jgi:hypothetical protein
MPNIIASLRFDEQRYGSINDGARFTSDEALSFLLQVEV